jgi:hypothetical protein
LSIDRKGRSVSNKERYANQEKVLLSVERKKETQKNSSLPSSNKNEKRFFWGR